MLRRIPLVTAALAVLAAPLALLGCPSDPEAGPADAAPDAPFDGASVCPTGFLGDPAKDPEIELRALTAEGKDVPLTDGADLAIIFPPQGGRVVFVGVRANNVDGCGIQITGAVRDRTTQQVRLDGRTLNLEREPDGWGTSGHGTAVSFEDSALIGNYSNVPVCPNQWAASDVFDHVFELEVLVKDRLGRKITKTITVTPRCAEPGAKETACRCLCKNGYILGESCGEDAGVDAGTL
ncbi:MAG: hypothetical protein JWP97_1661 [Labilithrix sp.]|nr:hypothetical protein [Labilithrix sp.]